VLLSDVRVLSRNAIPNLFSKIEPALDAALT